MVELTNQLTNIVPPRISQKSIGIPNGPDITGTVAKISNIVVMAES